MENINGQGLENFIKMIKSFQSEYKQYSVSLNFIYLPKGRKFSYIVSDKRRIAVIAKINDKRTGISIYVIEIATSDNRSLSTLMIKKLDDGKEEISIKKILYSLVYNSGSWSSEKLNKICHARIKHTKNNSREWARGIKGYL